MSRVKFSVFTLAFPGRTAEEALRLAAEVGFDGVDMRTNRDGHIYIDASREVRRRLVELADSLNIKIFSVYSYLGGDLVSPDPGVRERAVQELVAHVDLAVDLGATYVRIFPGTKERTRENYERFIESCRLACREAEDRGVYIGMETHGELAYSGDTCNLILERVGSEFLKVVYDVAGVHMQGLNPLKELREIDLGHVIAVQFHDFVKEEGRWRPVLLGEGEVPHEGIAKYLKDMGYEGFIVDEYEKWWHPHELPDPEEGLPHELSYLKKLFEV
ncbi:MAG: hypothetical protein DRK00_08885 [Thermoprotei archaeon]|nr:MAG: hypothetical protein DRK00_08885 [Thermoprotei archaeon]